MHYITLKETNDQPARPAVRDWDAIRKSAIRYWERKRIFYNISLVIPALLGYAMFTGVSEGIGDRQHRGTGAVIFLFLVSVVGANACYSFGYALEFFFGNDAPDSRWLRFWRPFLFVLGTLFAMVLAMVGGRNIAAMQYSIR